MADHEDIFQRSENALLAINQQNQPRKIRSWRGSKSRPPMFHHPWRMPNASFWSKTGHGLLPGRFIRAFVYREERVGAMGDCYASPIGVGNHVLIASQQGTITVLNAHSESLKVDHQIDFEGIMATPAMVSGRPLCVLPRKSTASSAHEFIQRPPDYLDLREFAGRHACHEAGMKGKHRRFQDQARPVASLDLMAPLPKVGSMIMRCFSERKNQGDFQCVSVDIHTLKKRSSDRSLHSCATWRIGSQIVEIGASLLDNSSR